MTCMAASDDHGRAASRWRGVPVMSRAIRVLEHVQDAVAAAVGIVLIVLACVLLVSGIVDSLDGHWGSVSAAAPVLLDRVLLVLILVEIVHTVVLSLRAHRLAAQPFIIVGLVAVIRRILFVLSSEVRVDTTELGLLILMLIAFVASFLAVSWFERREV